jgi:type VI secretion system secreted protein VgrG
MRFVQQDVVPTGLTDAQSLNRYSFVGGNPIQFMDPDGNWAGIDDFFVMLGSAIVSVVSQFIECAITSDGSFTGDACGWEDFAGAAVGGAAWGATMLYTGNPVLAGMAGGAFDSLATNGLKAIGGKTTWEEFGADFGLQVGIGGAFGGLGMVGKVGQKAGLSFGKSFTKSGFKQLTKQFGRGSWDLARKSLGAGLAIRSGVGTFKGAYNQGFWAAGGGGSGPVDRSTRPPGNVWNQYSDPQTDAWTRPAGNGCIDYAWR